MTSTMKSPADIKVPVKKSQQPDAPDDLTPDILPATSASDEQAASQSLAVKSGKFPFSLINQFDLIVSRNGRVFIQQYDKPNRYAVPLGSRAANRLIRDVAMDEGLVLRQSDIKEASEFLRAFAERDNSVGDVWYRVAPVEGGVEIDLGGDSHTRVRVTAGNVDIVHSGSHKLFYRLPHTRPLVMPADDGNLDLLKKYLNLDAVSVMLFLAWLTYTLAHPKTDTTKFVILVLQGDQGSGKTFLCYLIQQLIDPNTVGVRILPTQAKDLAIAAENGHVVAFDNVRGFKANMADLLCIASTGGSLSTRQLYTDDTEHTQRLHVAMVLNGIHSFVNQPDLAQRCLPIRLNSLNPGDRKSESDLAAELEADLPAIMRGLFDRIAQIFQHLPDAEVTNPERMLDFVKWLAAMETAYGAPPGAYQAVYSHVLAESQLDTLLDNPLAAAILDFPSEMNKAEWSGTPTDLYELLALQVPKSTLYSKYWPSNPIAMSKRLLPLQAGLREQGVEVSFSRGKSRTITITRVEGSVND